MPSKRNGSFVKYKPLFWLAVFLFAPSAMYKADNIVEYVAVAAVTIGLSALLIFYDDSRIKRVKSRDAKDLARFRRMFRLSRAKRNKG